jgi:tetratricopeptide (TPR) repeat protein
MKAKVFLPVLVLGMFLGLSLSAQEEKYGDDPESCRVNLSTYTEFFNQKNYKDAMPSWRWCFVNCPEATKNIYIHGTTIIEYYINEQTVAASREAYIDTLMMVYDNRIKYFNQKALVLGRKGTSMLKYRPDQVKEAYAILTESFELGGNATESFVIGFYMNTAVVLFGKGELTKENIVEIYSKLSDALNFQIGNETNEDKKAKLIESAKSVEEMFVNSGAADCPAIIALFGPKFEANPTDIDLAKKILYLLDKGKSDSCKLNDIYMNAAVAVYNVEKTSNSAHSIAQGYFKRGDGVNAEKYYEEAISLETDPMSKANMYYELGLLYYNTLKNYPKSRQAARSALANNPNYGKAYLLIGKVYAAGGYCGETAFERKSINWLIVDQFIKAKNVDPSVADEANELIGRFSGSFPTQEEGFWINATEGQVVTIGCWVGESTTVRYVR